MTNSRGNVPTVGLPLLDARGLDWLAERMRHTAILDGNYGVKWNSNHALWLGGWYIPPMPAFLSGVIFKRCHDVLQNISRRYRY